MASSPKSINSEASPSDDQSGQSSGGANFEQTLGRLEEIVHDLEDGKIGLDDALWRYEEGIGLLRRAYDTLQRAERKIELLTGVDSEGNPILRPMEDAASFSPEGDAVGRRPSSVRGGKAARGRRKSDLDMS